MRDIEFRGKRSNGEWVYGSLVIANDKCYDDKDEAIDFAKLHNWDEVVDDSTGKIVWRR